MNLPSLDQPGSASPTASLPAGVQLGPPSVTLVRAEPSGRILSTRELQKLPLTVCPTTKRIQSSRDQAMSPQTQSSGAPLALPTVCVFAPSTSTVRIVVG